MAQGPVCRLPGPDRLDAYQHQRADANRDGSLDRIEWARAGWTQARFTATDANQDGRVGAAEFLAGRRFEREFAAKDRNGDGFLSVRELMPLFGTVRRAVGEALRCVPRLDLTRFTRMDADRDGRISQAEYVRGRQAEERGYWFQATHGRTPSV